ncbi:HNH endonuclease [Streptomyces phage Forrest]|nr:HNH endonuclease [Streptomyces phage Forrest]QZE11509.1 HNH endonuclease [Streptomyces phage Jada]
MRVTLTASQWKRVEVSGPDDCWIWTGAKTNGYGYITVKNKAVRLSRVMLAWVDGIAIPDSGKIVLHSCDNPACVNPFHLSWGSNKDNTADMIAKGRAGWLYGQDNPASKLSEKDAIEIHRLRSEGWSQKDIAEEYSINQGQVSKILSGKRWPHLADLRVATGTW